jgi:hypothetical protein
MRIIWTVHRHLDALLRVAQHFLTRDGYLPLMADGWRSPSADIGWATGEFAKMKSKN